MRTIAAIAGMLCLSACAMDHRPAEANDAGRAALAQALAGRTAGQPQSCINPTVSRTSRTIDREGILFGTGSRIYLNRPRDGCPQLREGRALVTRTPTGQLCSGEIVRIVDPLNGVNYGACSLGEFIPYDRAP